MAARDRCQVLNLSIDAISPPNTKEVMQNICFHTSPDSKNISLLFKELNKNVTNTRGLPKADSQFKKIKQKLPILKIFLS